jgi:spore coat protein A
MRFKVASSPVGDSLGLNINTATDLTPGIDPTLLPTWGYTDDVTLYHKKRLVTLNEAADEYGRLIQILGDESEPDGSPYEGSATYIGRGAVGATEQRVTSGATEVWEIFNRTADTHPMHFHLVNVQLINRQLFDVSPNAIFPTLIPGVIPPEPNELGWKETVQMYPGTVTRVIMKFDLPKIVDSKGNPVNSREIRGFQMPIKNGQPPVSPRTGGNEYVWHCHILEHEEHDMMHALVVS